MQNCWLIQQDLQKRCHEHQRERDREEGEKNTNIYKPLVQLAHTHTHVESSMEGSSSLSAI